MGRREEDHRRELRRERDECRLVVEQVREIGVGACKRDGIGERVREIGEWVGEIGLWNG